MKKLVLLFAGVLMSTSVLKSQSYEDVKQYKAQKTYIYSELYFGWNNWRNSDGTATAVDGDPTTTELDAWPSTTWGFGFGGNSQLSESKFAIRYGVQFNWHYFRLKGNTVITKETTDAGDGTNFVSDPTVNYKKSVYRITYLDVPVMVEFFNGERGESKGFTIGLGGYGGVRLNSSHKAVYTDVFGDSSKDKLHNSYFSNPFRYGAMGQIGFSSFRVTAKMDLNTLFDQGKATPDYQVGSLTFGWVFP